MAISYNGFSFIGKFPASTTLSLSSQKCIYCIINCVPYQAHEYTCCHMFLGKIAPMSSYSERLGQ